MKNSSALALEFLFFLTETKEHLRAVSTDFFDGHFFIILSEINFLQTF